MAYIGETGYGSILGPRVALNALGELGKLQDERFANDLRLFARHIGMAIEGGIRDDAFGRAGWTYGQFQDLRGLASSKDAGRFVREYDFTDPYEFEMAFPTYSPDSVLQMHLRARRVAAMGLSRPTEETVGAARRAEIHLPIVGVLGGRDDIGAEHVVHALRPDAIVNGSAEHRAHRVTGLMRSRRHRLVDVRLAGRDDAFQRVVVNVDTVDPSRELVHREAHYWMRIIKGRDQAWHLWIPKAGTRIP